MANRVRVSVAAAILGVVAGVSSGCSSYDQEMFPGLFGEPAGTTSPMPKPTPAPETRTPNVDNWFSTYWILLPGGKEKVLCFEHTYDGDPRYNHANGVVGSCDWDDKQPVATGGGQ